MNTTSGSTVRLTVAQALVTTSRGSIGGWWASPSARTRRARDLRPRERSRAGQALDQLSDVLPFIQGRNEQALVHMAAGYAKATRRHATLAVTASIGPGAMNMITGAALATVNQLPVLLLPGDTYATRRQGPVLQQLQHPVEADASVNDAFRPVSRFFDRISRPEALLTACPRQCGC